MQDEELTKALEDTLHEFGVFESQEEIQHRYILLQSSFVQRKQVVLIGKIDVYKCEIQVKYNGEFWCVSKRDLKTK